MSVLFLVISGQAGAADWRDLGPARSAVATDGVRFAVWLRDEQSLAVRDEDGSLQVLAVPASCGGPTAPVVGSGLAAVACRPVSDYATIGDIMVVDLSSGAWTAVPHQPDGFDNYVQFPAALGRHWIRLEGTVDKALNRSWMSLDSGQRATLVRRRVYDDLDARKLQQPLCDPVKRPADPDVFFGDAGPRWGNTSRIGRSFVFRRPYTFDEDGSPELTDVVKWGCGQQKPERLARCPCDDLQVGGGLVSWQDGKRVTVTRPDGSRRARVAWAQPAGTHSTWRVRHTRRNLYRSGGPDSGGTTIYVRPLPRLRR